LLDVWWCVCTAFEILLEKGAITIFVECDADELRVEIVVSQSRFRALSDDASNLRFVEELEIISFVWDVGAVKEVWFLLSIGRFWDADRAFVWIGGCSR
jgi:hypothetical protein